MVTAMCYSISIDSASDPMRLVSTWAPSNDCPENLRSALSTYRINEKIKRAARTQFLFRTRLYISPGTKHSNLGKIKCITIRKLKESYPPRGAIIADSRTIYNTWYPHFAFGKQADSRMKRLPLAMLDTNQLQLDVKDDESVIIQDEDGKLVAFVMRNFCPDPNLLHWATEQAAGQIPLRRNIRKEDTGKLVLMGYSAGARSKGQFDWVRNITKKMTEEKRHASNADGSVLFAVAWQLIKSQFPEEIVDDFNDFVKSIGIRRMDWGGAGDKEATKQEDGASVTLMQSSIADGEGTIKVEVGNDEFEFRNVELAPPAGVIGQNYSRAIHREHHPHKWAVSWTLYRTPKSIGSDFFLADKGIRIRQASNTAIGWSPPLDHGTSLPDCDPTDADPVFRQLGVAFVTSNRLAGAWRKYQLGLISREEAEKEVAEHDLISDGDADMAPTKR
ncbi:hypothetical protein H0H93_005900 [Arthromyces matolae]|nr:hypothetical protein H0H93_005900 [Arthromyces matolae]